MGTSITFLKFWSTLPQLLEDMRRDCDGGRSIEILEEEGCNEEDDLDKILALSTPFRRLDGEWNFFDFWQGGLFT